MHTIETSNEPELVPVRLPESLWRRVQSLAAREDRSAASVVRVAVREYIEPREQVHA
jgi:predicted transcriptional regulator